jgi:HdeA/HdeB family
MRMGGCAMHKSLILATILLTTAISSARAQVDLSTYADANGFINVQTLTCAQLAGTWQGDADMLTTWYSGWYNGLARKHYLDLRKGKEAEHEVIVYCKANPDQLIIEAIAVVFKDMRARLGIEMKP